MAKKASAAKKSATKTTGRTGKPAKRKAGTTTKAKKAAKTRAAKKGTAKTAAKTRKAATKAARTTKSKTKKAPKTKVAKAKLPKCPLSRKELGEFRDMLMEKRRTLLGDMNGMQAEALRGNASTGEQSSMPVHMADIGTDNYEQEFTLGLLESERQLLREIDEALERMALGTYGICMGTGAEIGTARLRAKPWARYSIAYVRRIEQGLVRVPAIDYGASDDDEALA